MPELPEVEVVKRQLEETLKNQPRIAKVQTSRKKLRAQLSHQDKIQLQGQKVLSLQRRAKFILIQLENGVLLSHLGMTGRWYLQNDRNKKNLHQHVLIYFNDGRTLVYQDPRRFGLLEFYPESTIEELMQECRWLNHLGPEPLNTKFNGAQLKKQAQDRHTSVKSFIMDQKTVVGVGNIYAQEALFHSGISPHKECGKVSLDQYKTLVTHIKKILRQAIRAGGSSISDFEHMGGQKGYFQMQFSVYGRGGKDCPKCSHPLTLDRIGGRSSVWCRKCQKG